MKNFRIYLSEKIFYFMDINAETESEAEDKAATLLDSASLPDKLAYINYVEGPEILHDAPSKGEYMGIVAILKRGIDATDKITNTAEYRSEAHRDAMSQGDVLRAALKALEGITS